MWPRIGPVPTFGLLYLAGIVVHFLIGWRVAKRAGLKRRVWIATGLCYLVAMTLGAKVLHELRHGLFEASALLDIQVWTRGGMWGGLLAYFALALPLVLLLTRQRRAALDLVAVTIPVPWAMAKLGCLLNGCCYGKPCSLPWAVTFPEASRGAPAGVPLHPSQLYEIALMAIILLVFIMLRSPRWRGTKPLWFLALYGLGRAVTDLLRGDIDHSSAVGPLTLTQFVCLGAAGVALIGLLLIGRTHTTVLTRSAS